jgi:hypothetical protein
MHAVRLRGYGQAFAIAVYEIFSFGSSFSTPYMINAKYGNMGMNVGYVFGGEMPACPPRPSIYFRFILVAES